MLTGTVIVTKYSVMHTGTVIVTTHYTVPCILNMLIVLY